MSKKEINKRIQLNDGTLVTNQDDIAEILDKIKKPLHPNALSLLMQIQLSPGTISSAMLHIGVLETSLGGHEKITSLFQAPDLDKE